MRGFSHQVTGGLMLVIAALTAILTALLINAAVVDSQTRAALPRDGGQIISTRVVPANVKIEGDGPPGVGVRIHGFGGAIGTWDDIAPALSSKYRTIRIDLIGHGGTAAPHAGFDIDRQAKLVREVLDRLGVSRFTVIGYSMGGEVATALAEAQPDEFNA